MMRWVAVCILVLNFQASFVLADERPATPKKPSVVRKFGNSVRSCMIEFGIHAGWPTRAYRAKFGRFDMEPNTLIPERVLRWDDEIEALNPNGVFIRKNHASEARAIFTVENVLVKELNKKIDKNTVTATVNHYKRVFLEELHGHYQMRRQYYKLDEKIDLPEDTPNRKRELERLQAERDEAQKYTIRPKDVYGVYNDFKMFRIMLARDDHHVHQMLKEVTEKANARYAREVKKQSWFKKALRQGKLKGLATDPRRWNLAGYGGTLEQADVISRFGRIITTGRQSMDFSWSDSKRIAHNPELYRIKNGMKRLEPHEKSGYDSVFFDYTQNQGIILQHFRNHQVTRELLEKRLPPPPKKSLAIMEPYPDGGGRMMLTKDAIEVIRSVEVDPRFNTQKHGRKAYLKALGDALEKTFGENSFVGADRFDYHANLQLIKEYYDELNMYVPGLLTEKRVQIDLSSAKGTVLGVDFRGAGVLNLYETQKAIVRAQGRIDDAKTGLEQTQFLTKLLDDTRVGEEAATRQLQDLNQDYERVVREARLPVSGSRFTGDDGFSYGTSKMTERHMVSYMSNVAATENGHLFRSTFLDVNFADTGRALSETQKHRYIVFGEDVEKQLRKQLKGFEFDAVDLKNIFFGVHVVPNQRGGGKINLIVGANSKSESSAKAVVGKGGSRLKAVLELILRSGNFSDPKMNRFEVDRVLVPSF